MTKKIGVVGAGLMGSEIALVMALAGKNVLLSDTSEDALKRAKDNLGKILEKGVGRGFYSEEQVAPALGRIATTTALEKFSDRDLVIEAVFEQEDVKAAVFRKLDGICKPGCIIASNTSTIAISGLSAYVNPERRRDFLGMHFFSPVSRMKLVEVIPALDTAEETVDAAMAVCREAAKTPIKVKDVVGFAVNRVLHAFMIEAARLVEEGVATAEEVDLACKLGLGHPVGPFELSDAVTNKLCLQVQEILHDAYGPRFQPRPLLKKMVQIGYNGKNAGRGWYKYDKSKG
ncbi:MAG TPA: 3-hydroxyacyl-CoA dehydrogenase family protein [Burkholderiales bacterium]|nr:3-hydroxyacyl-CoA dehydrogenase family protein [Burkholderiales bacterium]